MCGIVGKLYFDRGRPVSADLIQEMMDALAHRGPDGEGKYLAGPVGLGHRRLSIIDLSTGSQPMSNEDETVWVTFNGEIYNYRDVRRDLLTRGHMFRTQSDTEVIVHLWEEYGVDCVQHLHGMFAFGIWDGNTKTLFLARDRVGIKPLYYCETTQGLIFASEMKALLRDPEVKREVSVASIDRFVTYLYLPGSETMFAHIRKLEPGHYLLARHGVVTRKQYWNLTFTPDRRWRHIDEAAEALGVLLGDRVADHMISDVPIGVLASGGVDSTALLSYVVERTDKPVQTFTVGFAGVQVVDERPYARLAAERYRTQHREITISADDFLQFLPRFVWHMEEPVCEPPAVALYYVCKLAREEVTVLLSGEGGDEAFGGYPEYRNYSALEQSKTILGPLAGAARGVLGLARAFIGGPRIERYTVLAGRPLPEYYYSRVTSPGDYFNRCKNTLYSSAFADATAVLEPTEMTRALFRQVRNGHRLNQMLYVDTKTWLPDDLLVKADRITMAASVELRVPFLDHTVLEFAAALPPEFKVRGRATKRVLRQAVEKRVPGEILKRRKVGFPVPYGQWLAGDLGGFVRETILSSKAISRGYFRRSGVEAVLSGERKGGASSREVFALLVLEMWHRLFVDAA
jgi:asparagine synthase (glutamine-hydrolysing)